MTGNNGLCAADIPPSFLFMLYSPFLLLFVLATHSAMIINYILCNYFCPFNNLLHANCYFVQSLDHYSLWMKCKLVVEALVNSGK